MKTKCFLQIKFRYHYLNSLLLWSKIDHLCVTNVLGSSVIPGGNRTGWFYDMNIGLESMHGPGKVSPSPGGGEEGGLEHFHHADQHGHKE